MWNGAANGWQHSPTDVTGRPRAPTRNLGSITAVATRPDAAKACAQAISLPSPPVAVPPAPWPPQGASLAPHSRRVLSPNSIPFPPRVAAARQGQIAVPHEGDTAAVAVELARDGAPAAVAARLVGEASSRALDGTPDDEIVARHLLGILDLVGDQTVLFTQVTRWRYCRATVHAEFDEANHDHSGVVVCGDAVAPGGMAAAFDSGLRAVAPRHERSS